MPRKASFEAKPHAVCARDPEPPIKARPSSSNLGRRKAAANHVLVRNLVAKTEGKSPVTSKKGEKIMQITDPIADMLTRIRNAGVAKHETVDVPASKMKKAIAEILLNEGYIKSFQIIDDGTQGIIRITLKYLPGKEKAIQGLRRVSKPGLRVYAGADELPKVLKGLGIAIVSTSKGVMTDKAARAAHIGGEVLAFVW